MGKQAVHLSDGISDAELQNISAAFDSGHHVEFDATTFGCKVGDKTFRGDGIVDDEGTRHYSSIRWQENDQSDFDNF